MQQIRIKMRKYFFIGMLVSLCMACMSNNPDEDEGANLGVGDALPSFVVTMNDGTSVASSDLLGHPSVIVFFSTSCPDCQKELPELQRLWDASDRTTTPILLISRAQGQAEIEKYWQSQGLNMLYSPQSDRTIYHLFATSRIPRIYISDSKGIIRYIHTDEVLPTCETLQAELQTIKK